MAKKISNNILEVISLSEFTSIVSEYKNKKNIFYRGQKNKSFNISCSLSRDYGYVENEYNMIYDTLQVKSEEFKSYKYPIEILSKMQHYEIPTRLIDVTLDPYIALYFSIEESEETNDAEVFVFEKESYSIDSKDVRLVSLLSMSNDYSTNKIIELYKETYSEEISENEIINIIKENKFIDFNEQLSKSNERLSTQKGSFILCTNLIEDNLIKIKIHQVKKSESICTIRIPFEYKDAIKKDLDIKYNINKHMIYPELNIFAKHIKAKYKSTNNKSVKKYNFKIIEKYDSSNALAKRLSIKIELEKRLPIASIKEIVYKILKEYENKYQVLWIFVYSSQGDSIMNNWTVKALWIDDKLNDNAKPITFGILEEDNINWEYGTGISYLREYYEENIFEDDKNLLELNSNELKKLKKIYFNLKEEFNKYPIDTFLNTLDEYKKDINKIYLRFQNFGLSRNVDISKHLQTYQEIACYFDNLRLTSNPYSIKNIFDGMDKKIAKVEYEYETLVNRL